MRVEEFAEELDFDLPEDRDYDTVAGLILSCLPSIPEDGATPSVEVCGLHFDVQTVEDRKILWAMVRKVTPPKPEEDPEKKQEESRAAVKARNGTKETRANRLACKQPAA